jgi:hypothetical protein
MFLLRNPAIGRPVPIVTKGGRVMRKMQHSAIVGFGIAAMGLLVGLSGQGAAASELAWRVAPTPAELTKATDLDLVDPAVDIPAPSVTPSPGTRTGLWAASVECLYGPGEPRALPPCVPPPPCDPSHPSNPYDLVGVAGVPTCGPIYGGPCEPRTGTHDDQPLWRLHRVHDRLFDWFYRSK